ncbi:sulfonate transport system substrate-binding protein [Saccharopolyspora kobensis]|uniref:Putative aliphatic sulfonates-binding protein n=1 Tax=Saccharopolyspora kobensis TaxID=146035 RepID=A0A1H5UN81_9PSEU|nr:ABC transporter substrate-binding protein [Saccharopolyspora kobensis]SEF75898.1 sulfonate transport system substrate-binding protein [Saccharopolyspora kobensis]SFC72046.1 sulfonate transport system substrate-binding protein [Saccharopolyspora kobensis]
MRRRDFLTVLAISSTGFLSACAGGRTDPQQAPVPPPAPPEQLASVTLRVGDQKGNSRSLLRSAGLDDFPYTVEWATFPSGPPLLEAISADAVDIGGVGNTPPLFAAAAKAKIRVVAASKGNVASDALVVLPDSPLQQVAQLRGRKIAVAKGSSAHGQILLTLRKAGLTPADVELVYLQPSDAMGAFKQGSVDAWAIWDPYFSQIQLESAVRLLADGRGTANGLSFQVAGPAALADAGRNTAIADYLVRLARAQRFADANREQRAQAWAEDTGLPVEVTRRATELGPDLPVELNAEVIRSEQELADAFVAAEEIPRRFEFAEFVDTRFAAQLATA